LANYKDEAFGFALKRHLTKEIEDRLTNDVPSQGFEANVQRINVADI